MFRLRCRLYFYFYFQRAITLIYGAYGVAAAQKLVELLVRVQLPVATQFQETAQQRVVFFDTLISLQNF